MAAAAAMGDLFAPAYIHGNPESEAAVAKWQAENHAVTPAMVEQTRGPSTTITDPRHMSGTRQLGGFTPVTSTIPGSVDPEALRILAQGGKYTMLAPPAAAPAAAAPVAAPAAAVAPAASSQRDAIASQLMSQQQVPGYGQFGQQSSVPFPINWTNSNVPFATS